MFPVMRVRPERGLAVRRPEFFGPLANEFESLVNRCLTRWAIPDEWFAAPAWEVAEAEKEVVYRMPLPGFTPAEVHLSIVANELTLLAAHRPAEGAKAPEEERRFEMTVTLPAGLELERMEAMFRNGLLEVHIPRVPAAVPRRIEVRT
jgi:HSP20 family protein